MLDSDLISLLGTLDPLEKTTQEALEQSMTSSKPSKAIRKLRRSLERLGKESPEALQQLLRALNADQIEAARVALDTLCGAHPTLKAELEEVRRELRPDSQTLLRAYLTDSAG